MKVLNIDITDSKNGNIINVDVPNILINDKIEIIKEKIFALGKSDKLSPYLPRLFKLNLNGLLLDDNSKILSSYYYNDILNLEITNILDKINPIEAFKLYLDEKERLIKYNELFQEYNEMTMDDFTFVIMFILLVSGEIPDNLKVEFNERLSDEMTLILDLQDKLKQKYINIETNEYMSEFYKLSKSNTDDSSDLIEKSVITNIDINIRGKNVEIKKFININILFNILELSDKIPFIALSKKHSDNKLNEPLIKIYNPLLNSISSKEVKNWVLNEKKKSNQVSFKNIKGLMLKIKIKELDSYLTLNIYPNGIINTNIELLPNNTNTFLAITDIIKDVISEFIKNVNVLDIFIKSNNRIIESLEDSTIDIKSINQIINTTFYIDKDNFKKILRINSISNNVLELKKTESMDISVLYKNTNRERGITINIKDNPYNLESSIISIFGGENLVESDTIIKVIYILNILGENIYEEDGNFIVKKKIRKEKEKTNKMKLKEEGFLFNSKKCQPPRQPYIISNDNTPNDNVIKFDKWTFKCSNKSHAYPGFLKDDIPCCFKNNQIGNETYIRNMDPSSLNIFVKPSNIKVKLFDLKNKGFETFVIKKDDDANNFYYISENNQLNMITDTKVINYISTIEENNNIWLELVPLSTLIYPPSTNKCSTSPIINNKLSSKGINTLINKNNINGACKHHTITKTFGYGGNSIPCCYENARPEFSIRTQKEFDITKQYITSTSNKILNFQKIGVLQSDLNILFNTIIENNKEIENEKKGFFRMGVIQNNNSFLGAVLLGINNKIGDLNISGVSDFKRIIIEYLDNNPGEFNKLNKGKIFFKYNSIKNYKKYINDSNVFLYWNDLIDLIEEITKVNILILDCTKDTKILCRPQIKNTLHQVSIILIKNKYNSNDTYELLVKLEKSKKQEKIILLKSFDNESKIIKFMIDFYKNSCTKDNVYPDIYSYIPLDTFNTMKDKINSILKNDIKYQIVNNFNRVSLVMTSNFLLLPIIETGILENLEIILFDDYIKSDKLLNIKEFEKLFKLLNITILGITASNINNIGGLLTDYGYILPFKYKIFPQNLTILNYIYYTNIDEKISNKSEFNTNYNKYINNLHLTNNEIFSIKSKLFKKLQNLDIEEFKETLNARIIKNTKLTNSKKISKIVDIFKQIIKTPTNIHYEFLLKIIANEIILDNVSNSFLNGIFTNDFDEKNIIKRETESILLNLDDIYKWVNLYEEN